MTRSLRLVFDEETLRLLIGICARSLDGFRRSVWSNDDRLEPRRANAQGPIIHQAYQLILEPSSSTVVPYLEYFQGTYPLGMTLGTDGQLRSIPRFSANASRSSVQRRGQCGGILDRTSTKERLR